MKYARFATLMAALLSLALTLTSCRQNTAEPSATPAAKTFILGLDDSFPPMGFRNEQNEIVGYDIDLAREVCKRLGFELVLRPIDWNAKELEIASGNIDCIWNGFTMTPERQEALTFTPAYLRNAQVIVVRAASTYKTLEDLAGKTVEAQAGSSAMEAIDGAADFKKSLKEVIGVKDNLTALMDLEAGGVDAVCMDLLVANDNIQRSGKDLRILEQSLAPEEYGIGFKKGNTELRDQVWKTLVEMAQDGTIKPIAEKWFGKDISIIGQE